METLKLMILCEFLRGLTEETTHKDIFSWPSMSKFFFVFRWLRNIYEEILDTRGKMFSNEWWVTVDACVRKMRDSG